jgi:hypothetical protein
MGGFSTPARLVLCGVLVVGYCRVTRDYDSRRCAARGERLYIARGGRRAHTLSAARQGLTGKTLARNRALAARGYVVVSVPVLTNRGLVVNPFITVSALSNR